ncbi:MAG: hypothetical protein Q8N14_04360, partial [Candidatus Omnitrophota bacterium]|nr:hypothetical protein [Candidatus Omnitrophota bacterium]
DVADSGFKKSGKEKIIFLRTERVALLLGQAVSEPKIKSILNALGLKVNQAKKNNIKITIPSFRPDLKQEEDLVEEIARQVGFDQLPSSLPAIKISSIPEQPIRRLYKMVRDCLVATGLNEVITYSLINKDSLKKIGWNDFAPIKIKNPLSLDQEIMRPTLFSGFLSVMRNNLNHNIEEIKIFEIGKIYTEYGEIPTLGLGIMGPKNKFSLLDLKGSLEALFKQLRIKGVQFDPAAKNFFTAEKSFTITVDNEDIGYLGELSLAVANNLDFKHQKVFLSQLNLETLLKFVKWDIDFTPLINFPLVRRDISLIIKEEITSGQIIALIKKEAGPLLIEVLLCDQYSGEQIPAGYKGLTYCLEFQATNRTLSDNEVNNIQSKLCDLLAESFAARIRR